MNSLKHTLLILFACFFFCQGLSTTAQAAYVDGTYTASVRMEQFYALGSASMCDPLFHSTAHITISGDTATLSLYVIDPIPEFPDHGTPLSNVNFQYGGKTYSASYTTSNKGSYSYSQTPGFIGSSGSYPSSRVGVDLPVAALDGTSGGTLVCEAYVNVVMQSTQKFFVVLGSPNLVKAAAPSVTETPESTAPSTPDSEPDAAQTTTTPESENPSESTSQSLGDGSYTPAVSMYKVADIDSLSMCNALFYDRASVEVAGDTATITLYVIDPIPLFVDYGTPLANVNFQYEGKTYDAVYITTDRESYTFAEASGFIPEDGIYTTAKVQVDLPKEAVEATGGGTLVCEAYINVVMQSTQQFFVMLSQFEEGTLTSEAPIVEGGEQADTTVDVTPPTLDDVPPNLSLDLPEEVAPAEATENGSEFRVDRSGLSLAYTIVGLFSLAVVGLSVYTIYLNKRRKILYELLS